MRKNGIVINHGGKPGQLAIIDFYHADGEKFRITPAAGWTLHKEWYTPPLTVVRFVRVVTEHEIAGYWAFSWPADPEYMIDYF